ncbi:hypothetical protein ACVWWR_007481 [Bradyrhizobium sp. LM3.2]
MVGALEGAPDDAVACALRPLPDLACSTSRATTRPCGPVPVTIDTSRPDSLASRRASGEENTRPPWPLPCAAGAAAAFAAGVAAGDGAALGGADLGATGAGAGASAAFGGAADALGLAAPAAFTSSPSPASTAITSLTGTSCVPSGTRILAIVPSSMASTSMVALSVSISAMMSPDLTLSPSFFSHLARLPFSIVGERAGIRMLMGMLTSRRTSQNAVPGSEDEQTRFSCRCRPATGAHWQDWNANSSSL